jgi:hypothetical protein
MNNISYTILDIIIYNILSFPIVFKLLLYKRLNGVEANSRIIYKLSNYKSWEGIKIGYLMVWILLFYFCVEARYSGDWIHYREHVEAISSGFLAFSGMEPVYKGIILLLGGNYIAFRMVVWGVALLFLYKLLKRFEINNNITLSIFVIWGLYLYAYPRVSLGISLFFYGYSILITTKDNERTFKKNFKAIFLILFSCIFHKSMLVLLVIVPFSFVKFTRRRIGLLLVAFVFVTIILYFFLGIVTNNFGEMDGAGMEYLTGEMTASSTFGYRISAILHRAPIFIIMLSFVYNYSIRGYYKYLSGVTQHLYSFCLCIVAFALVFAVLPLSSNVLYYRVLYMIFIPLSCLMYKSLTYAISNRAIYYCTLLAYLGNNYSLFYDLLGHINGTIQ